jgi:hypothetical protein
LAYAISSDSVVPTGVSDSADGYLKVYQAVIHHALHTGTSFRNDKRTMWDIMSNICGQHECWTYIKPVQKANDGRKANKLLFDHFLGSHKVGNTRSSADTKLNITLYNGEKKRFTWEMYVRIHTEQHAVLNGLKGYGYS